jgi:probable AcnD-accessory protein PrpF
VPKDGIAVIRIWQANIGKTIVAHVPMTNGEVQETGDFELDGVTFPAAEVVLEFMDPAEEGDGGALFPTGNVVDDLEVPGIGTFKTTMINSGIPTIFLEADALGYTGTELQDAVNNDTAALKKLETIRAYGALKMGLISNLEEAKARQHTPKIAWVAGPTAYTSSSGKKIEAQNVDLLVRAMSMGKLHHAMMGTASVAIATAAAITGTLVNLAAGGAEREAVCFGHPSGTLRVGSKAQLVDGEWQVSKAIMSRSARVLMSGWVHLPFAS